MLKVHRPVLRHLSLGVVTLLIAGCAGQTPTTPTLIDTAPFSSTDLRIGSGAAAAAGDIVTAIYTSWLYDADALENKGVLVETGVAVQFVLGVGQVIPGWDQGVLGMQVGGLRRLIVPPEAGFGAAGFGPYPASATIVFEIELLRLDPFSTDSAPFSITDLAVGDGVEALAGDDVVVAYQGWLYRADEPENKGLQIDVSEGLAFRLGAGQVIPGFDAGVTGMRVGGQRRVVIPPELAYGEQGTTLIPPNATLVFDIRLLAST